MTETMEHDLSLLPSNEIKFSGPFTQVVTSHLRLTNKGSKALCYKVKTTAPKMYCVRPNSGLIEPHHQVEVSIMLQPFEYNPCEKVRHKFLIQSVVADENNLENYEQLWKTVDKDMVKEVKLKCSFEQDQIHGDVIIEDEIVVSKNVSNNAQPGLAMTVEDLKKQLLELKMENEKLKSNEIRLRKIAIQDTLDNSVLPNASSTEDAKYNLSNNLLLMIVLSFICFLVGIVVAKFSQ